MGMGQRVGPGHVAVADRGQHLFMFIGQEDLAAALFESYRLRENLPLSMVTGKRRKLSEH